MLLLAPDVLQQEELRSCEVTLEYPFAPDDPRLEGIFPGTARGVELLQAEGVTTGTVATARVLCEQEPNPASRVTLTRAKDALGMPRIELDWRLTRDDRVSMLRTLARVGSEIGRLGLGRLRVDVSGYTNADPQPRRRRRLRGEHRLAPHRHRAHERGSDDAASSTRTQGAQRRQPVHRRERGVPDQRCQPADAHDRRAGVASRRPPHQDRAQRHERPNSLVAIVEPVDGAREAVVERRPGLPPEVDGGATGIERRPQQLARPLRRPVGWLVGNR